MEFTWKHRLAIVSAAFCLVALLIVLFASPGSQGTNSSPETSTTTIVEDTNEVADEMTEITSFVTNTSVPDADEAENVAVIGTSPDGTPLSSGAPEDLFPTIESTVPVVISVTTIPTAQSTVYPPDIGPLDRAEAFVEAYFTYYELDTPESWKARMKEHITSNLEETITFIEVEEGVGIRANIEPIDEGVGEVSDVAADFPIRVNVEKYVDGKFVAEEEVIVYVKLAGRASSWLVASYGFNE